MRLVAEIAQFTDRGAGQPFALSNKRVEGTKTTILKEVKEVIDSYGERGLGKGNICVTIKEVQTTK